MKIVFVTICCWSVATQNPSAPRGAVCSATWRHYTAHMVNVTRSSTRYTRTAEGLAERFSHEGRLANPHYPTARVTRGWQRSQLTSKAQRSLYVPPGLTFTNSTFCPHSVFMCFVWISEQTSIISLYSINWLVCITETECVYCAVWTGYLK
jgi:hypothetical protein